MTTAAMSGAPGLGQPTITKEMAQTAMVEYKRMKDAGRPENDPELLKYKQILMVVAQHNKLRNAYQQQQQQLHAAQHNQPNGHHMQQSPNPPSQHPSQAVNGAPAPSSQSPRASALNQQHGGLMIMTDEQKMLLRNQMQAFKMLSRDVPLSHELQNSIFLSRKMEQSPAPIQSLDAASQALDNASKPSQADTEEPDHSNIAPPVHTFKDPYSLKSALSYFQHGDRKNRLVIPSIRASGVDVDRLRQERENIIYNNLRKRKEELEKLPANWASWDTTKTDEPTPDSARKLKALIEYKSLCFLTKQRDLRARIAREMVEMNSLAMTANRSKFRRQKKQSIMAAKNTERLERQQREARASKEKQKQEGHLKAILDHAHQVKTAAMEQNARVTRIGKLMVDAHKVIEKEEQKRIERTAKQRLQALKANDEETYLKLLGQAKDSRISHLLKQTDNFLNQLAASVRTQQRSNGTRKVDSESESEEDDAEEDEDGSKKVDYYEVAHKIKEEVTSQSSNLVGGTLKEYQLKGLQWMISLYNNKLNGILADEMGLGKTIQTISLITYLIERKQQHGPYLVIVPLSTLTNWNNEFEKWAPSIQRIVYKGPPNARKQAQAQIRSGQFQVLLTTYEYIIRDRPVLSKVKWLHMIVDEGHRMKNAQSKLSSTISMYYQTKYRLILTGTPLQNNLPELWALLNFVLPNIFKSVKSFDEWFNTPFANTGGQDKMDLTEEEQLLVIKRLHKVLRPFLLRRLKKDVEKDLPDKQERVIKCNFSSLQRKLYQSLMTTNKLMVSDGKGGKTGLRGLSNMLMQLRKLCNHPFVFEEVENQINPLQTSNDLLWRTAGKFELLDRILPKFQRTGHRVLMFFQMTQIMNIMEDFMRLRGFPYLRLDGSTKSEERADLLKAFNAPDSPYFCFLLSTRAGGLGLNLQTADTVIIYDSDWNPHQDLQAQDRAHRIGQKNEVRILRLITSNSVEEKILERAQFKLDMDGKVIQAGKFDNKSTNEERDAMLRVMLESAEAAETMEQDEMDDDDLNLLMIRSDEELGIFQQIDAERAKDPLYGPGKKYPRLFSDEELPDIYMHEDEPADETVEDLVMGRGARERTRVRYDDGLTEEQWLEAVDNDEDTIEAAIARKEAKVARRVAKHDKKGGNGSETLPDTPPPAARESSEEAPMSVPKKRGRKTKNKRTADEASLDSEPMSAPPPPPPKRRSRPSKAVAETLTPAEREAVQTALDTVHDSLMDLEAEPIDGYTERRQIIDPFLSLPPRQDYPDYYAIIKQPVCMETIGNRVNEKRYQSLDDFARDVKLLCDNARTYNEDGSLLYQDAQTIEATAFRLLSEESAKHSAELGRATFSGVNGMLAGGGGVSSSATPGPSGTGTPSTGNAGTGFNNGTKIRLNLNGASAEQ